MDLTQSLLTLFSNLPDMMKLVVWLTPPVFILVWRALSLAHRLAMRKLAVDHLPLTLEDLDLINRHRRARLAEGRAQTLFDVMDAEADLAELRRTAGREERSASSG